MKSKMTATLLIAVLSLIAAASAAAAPEAGPCVPGGGYNPACDADQNGQITVTDIQLTAGHWNQSGTFTSDSNHTHLGQTWIGASNPLKIQGAFGAPDYAALVLNNTSAHGLAINNVGLDGIYVGTAGAYGMVVNDAAWDGVYVNVAGNPTAATFSAQNNGFEVAGAEGNGLYVGRADAIGVRVNSTGGTGIYVESAGENGVRVGSASYDGVYVANAGDDGVDVYGSAYAGNFLGNIYVSGNCIGCLQANFAVNAGDRALQPGDVVSVQAVMPTNFDAGATVWQVVAAQPGQTVVGVVAGRAELVIEEDHRPTETGERLVPREGAAQPGEYATIVYSGPMQVRATGPIAAGAKLTVDEGGNARGLRKTEVNGVRVAEDAPVLGIALSESQDSLVWVLVNPQ